MSAFKFDIELRPHKGIARREGVDVEFEHPQWVVVVGINGQRPVQRGYIGHKSGGFMPLAGSDQQLGRILFEEMSAAIVAERDKKLSPAPANPAGSK